MKHVVLNTFGKFLFASIALVAAVLVFAAGRFWILPQCDQCHGSGELVLTCNRCHGSGKVPGMIYGTNPCSDCEGSGKTKSEKCSRCIGRGETPLW